MKQNNLRRLLPKKLMILDLEKDIKRLTLEFEFHKLRSNVIGQVIEEQQMTLDKLLETRQTMKPQGDFYK